MKPDMQETLKQTKTPISKSDVKTEVKKTEFTCEFLAKVVSKFERNIAALNNPALTVNQRKNIENILESNFALIVSLEKILDLQLKYLSEVMQKRTSNEVLVLENSSFVNNQYINSQLMEKVKTLVKDNIFDAQIANIKDLNIVYEPKKNFLDRKALNNVAKDLQEKMIESINKINFTADEKKMWIEEITNIEIYNESSSHTVKEIEKQRRNHLKVSKAEQTLNTEIMDILSGKKDKDIIDSLSKKSEEKKEDKDDIKDKEKQKPKDKQTAKEKQKAKDEEMRKEKEKAAKELIQNILDMGAAKDKKDIASTNPAFLRMAGIILELNKDEYKFNKENKLFKKSFGYQEDYFSKSLFTDEFRKLFLKEHDQDIANYATSRIHEILNEKRSTFMSRLALIKELFDKNISMFVGKDYMSSFLNRPEVKRDFYELIIKHLRDQIDTEIKTPYQEKDEKSYFLKIKRILESISALPAGFLEEKEKKEMREKILELLDVALKENMTIAQQIDHLLIMQNDLQKIGSILDMDISEIITKKSIDMQKELTDSLQTISDSDRDDYWKMANKINLLHRKMTEFEKVMPGNQFKQKMPIIEGFLSKQLSDLNTNLFAKLDSDFSQQSKKTLYGQLKVIHDLRLNIIGIPSEAILTKCNQLINLIDETQLKEEFIRIAKHKELSLSQKIDRFNLMISVMGDKIKSNKEGMDEIRKLLTDDSISKEITTILGNKDNTVAAKLANLDSIFLVLENTAMNYSDHARDLLNSLKSPDKISKESPLYKLVEQLKVSSNFESNSVLFRLHQYLNEPDEVKRLKIIDSDTEMLNLFKALLSPKNVKKDSELFKLLYSVAKDHSITLDLQFESLAKAVNIPYTDLYENVKDHEQSLIDELAKHYISISRNAFKEFSLERLINYSDKSPYTPEITNYVNRLANTIEKDVCSQPDLMTRVRHLSRWIEVAKRCITDGDIATAKTILEIIATRDTASTLYGAINLLSNDQKDLLNKAKVWSYGKDQGYIHIMNNREICQTDIIVPHPSTAQKLINDYGETGKFWIDTHCATKVCEPLIRNIQTVREKAPPLTVEMQKTKRALRVSAPDVYVLDRNGEKYERTNPRYAELSTEIRGRQDRAIEQPAQILAEAQGKVVNPLVRPHIDNYDFIQVSKKLDANESKNALSIGNNSTTPLTKALGKFQKKELDLQKTSFKPTTTIVDIFWTEIRGKLINCKPALEQKVAEARQKHKEESDKLVKYEKDLKELTSKIDEATKKGEPLSDLDKANQNRLTTNKHRCERNIREASSTINDCTNDIKIINSLPELPSNLNPQHISLVNKYVKFQDKFRDGVYSYKWGVLDPLTNKYKNSYGVPIAQNIEFSGEVNDLFVYKNNQFLVRDLAKQKTTLENLEVTDKTSDSVIKLLLEVNDIMEIDVRKELAKYESNFSDPIERVDNLNALFFIIDERFNQMIHNLDEYLKGSADFELNKERPEGEQVKIHKRYREKYVTAAQELQRELVNEQQNYRQINSDLRNNLQTLIDEASLLNQAANVQRAPIPLSHTAVPQRTATEGEAAPVPLNPVVLGSAAVERPLSTKGAAIIAPNSPPVDSVKPPQATEGAGARKSIFSRTLTFLTREPAKPKLSSESKMAAALFGGKESAVIALQRSSDQHEVSSSNNEEKKEIAPHEKSRLQITDEKINFVYRVGQSGQPLKSDGIHEVIDKFIKSSGIVKRVSNISEFNLNIFCRELSSPDDIKASIGIKFTRSNMNTFQVELNFNQLANFDAHAKLHETISALLKSEFEKKGINITIKTNVQEHIDSKKQSLTKELCLGQVIKELDAKSAQPEQNKGSPELKL